jgi:hypothetical protein
VADFNSQACLSDAKATAPNGTAHLEPGAAAAP